MSNKKFTISHYGDFNLVREFVEFYIYSKETGEIVENISFSCNFSDFGEIDILLLSYIILFQKDFPETKFLFTFSENQTESGFKVIHQLTHSNITCGLVNFEVIVNYRKKDGNVIKNIFKNSNINLTSPNFIESMIPSLFIDTNSIEHIFKAGCVNKLWANIQNEQIANKQKIKSDKDILDFFKKNNRKLDVDAIAKIYLLKTLQQLGILRKNLLNDDDYQIGRYIGVGEKNRKEAIYFRNKVNEVLNARGFYDFNLIELFFFSMLITKCLKLTNISTNNLSERQNQILKNVNEIYIPKIDQLIKFTKDLTLGINELAKNIIEHSSEKRGVITGKIYNRHLIKEFKKGRINDYLENNEKDDFEYFLDINVVDVGLTELKNNYISNLENTILLLKDNTSTERNNYINKIEETLRNDINTIKNKDFKFSDFLNYETIKMEHQTRKVLSRLGLLIFSNQIINKHNGFIKVASGNFIENQLNGAFLFKKNYLLNTFKGNSNDFIPIGTNYNFIVPINLIIREDTMYNKSNFDPKGSSLSTFKELFNYQIIESQDENIDKKRIPIYLNPFGIQLIKTGKYEKHFSLKNEIIERTNNYENMIIAIDAEKLATIINNSSEWVRFIANLQMSENPMNNIIIYNIDEKIHDEIIEINTLFDNTNFGFWSDNQYVLFYVKIGYQIGNCKLSIWFNDVLSMKSYNKYLNLNKAISHYHYNLYSITDSKKEETEDVAEGSGAMFLNGKLLNFELLLKANSGYSLFEESVMSLLNLEIKTQ